MTGILRVLGTVVAAGLATTGVGLPLALGIGAGLSAAGNAGADEIEKKQAREKADAEAARAKQEAHAKIEQQRQAAEAKARELEAKLREQQEHTALPGRVLDASRRGDLGEFKRLLGKLDDNQIKDIGLSPIAECKTEQQIEITDILEAELKRRGL